MDNVKAAHKPSRFSNSIAYRDRAEKTVAFGVSSTVRGLQMPAPIVVEKASGVILTDIDDNDYIDYGLGYGPLLLGHSPACVISAVNDEMARGLRIASVHEGEAKLAELIAECVPCAELTSFVSTGTEAVQLALRIARVVTGKRKIIKFRANYHGWSDNIMVGAEISSDGPATVGQDPTSASSVVLVDWGDLNALEAVLDAEFAAVILEPAAINPGCFSPPPGFLQGVRDLTARLGVLLIFDEVITGFRLALGGAQEYYGVTPDMVVLGKVLGGGLPIGAVSGTRDVMEPVWSGRLNQRGTFNGNPLSIAAGIACVSYMQKRSVEIFPRMEKFASDLAQHFVHEATRFDISLFSQSVGPTLQVFAGLRSMQSIQDLVSVDMQSTARFMSFMLEAGIHGLPRGLMYLSTVHSAEHIDQTKVAITACMEKMAP